MTQNDLSTAITLIKGGQKSSGARILRNLLRDDPANIQALLWLSEAVDDDQEKRRCLEEALKVEPDNALARRGLHILSRRPTWERGAQLAPSQDSHDTSIADHAAGQVNSRRDAQVERLPAWNGSKDYRPAKQGPRPAPVVDKFPGTPLPVKAQKMSAGSCLVGALIIGSVLCLFSSLASQCSGSRDDQSTQPPTLDPGEERAIAAVKNQSTLLGDNMAESIAIALTVTELEGHTTSMDGWYVSSAADHHAVFFRFYVDDVRQSAEWWYYPGGRIVPKNEWAFVFMGQ